MVGLVLPPWSQMRKDSQSGAWLTPSSGMWAQEECGARQVCSWEGIGVVALSCQSCHSACPGWRGAGGTRACHSSCSRPLVSTPSSQTP